MAAKDFSAKIEARLRQGEYESARTILEKERQKDPQNHWILTQLGVTLYEQGHYHEALPMLMASLKIVADCPLTLWNLAGILDALGKHAKAIEIYTWLLETEISPDEDPCWESEEWTAALKTDCVYRVGVCYAHLGAKKRAEQWYRHYLELLISGVKGSYSIEDVMRQLREVRQTEKRSGSQNGLQKVVDSALQDLGIKPRKDRRPAPPKLNLGKLAKSR